MPLSSSGVSLAVPPSQNTAEVHEFRCLFTHDVRRKAKRWHDGYLTFHTFNSRAIVFDDSRHKVGDTYTKAGDRVNEGDDLTLQQGVLVEVGEPLGTREQDVSQVIVARDSPRAAGNNAGRPPVQPRPQSQRPGLFRPANGSLPAAGPNVALGTGNAPALAGQRPKSLKEVLSTPSGSMGRARISARSPYERRHDNLSGRHEMKAPLQICRIVEPAAPLENDMGPRKRQRLNGDGGNGVGGTDITSQVKERQRQGIGSGNAVATSPSSRSQVSIQNPGTRAVNPILLESDEEVMRQSPLTVTPIHISAAPRVPTDKQEAGRTADESTGQNTKQKKSKPKPKSKSKSALKPREDMEIAPEPVKKAKSKLKIAKERKSNEEECSRNESSSSRSSKPSSSEDLDTQSESRPLQERSINLLRMSSTGRRRKLMYSDLVPNRHVSKKSKLSQDFIEEDGGENTLEASSTASKRKLSIPNDKIAKKRKKKPLLIQDVDDDESEDTLSSNAAERHIPSRAAQEDTGSAISHEGSDIHEDTLTADMSIMDVADEFSVNEEHQEGVGEPQLESLADRDKTIVSAQRRTQVVTSDARPPPSHSVARHDIPTLPPANASSQHSTSTKQSENESVAPDKVETTDQQQIGKEGRHSFEAAPCQTHHSHRSPLKRVISAPITKSPRQVRLLTKSISDMSSIAAGADAPDGAAAEEEDAFLDLYESTDLGPWSREAFDLFGWKEGDRKGVDDESEESKELSGDQS